MHAVVTSLTFPDRSAVEAELPKIVSRVSAIPGFVAGYWVALGAESGASIIVFDSQEAAEVLANFARGAPYASVTPEAIQLGEVLAHASAESTDQHTAGTGPRSGAIGR